jgi:hypothetical protein
MSVNVRMLFQSSVRESLSSPVCSSRFKQVCPSGVRREPQTIVTTMRAALLATAGKEGGVRS